MSEIVLTADRTLMTDYNGITTLGYNSCFPYRLLPNFVIRLLLPKLHKGQATYALRRVEAKLLDEGFDVTILPPQDIKKIKKIKPQVVGISTVDPLTQKPNPWTLSNIFGGGESVIEHEFTDLILKLNEIRKTQDFKIIVGGRGSSELETNKKFREMIDCIVIGEGEGSIELFRKALNNEPLPHKYISDFQSIDDLSIIKGASRNGHVQITRGCPRACQFCSFTPLNWISYPKERILKEIKVNLSQGIRQISLISEDVLLYGSKDVEVNEHTLLDLIRSVSKLGKTYNVKSVNLSDVSIAATIKGKNTCQKITEILNFSKDRPCDTFIGVETGSERLIKKYMGGKAKPFNPDNWGELVKEGIDILNDNYWFPVCCMITGLPDENEDDVIKTLNLVDDLKENRLFYFVFYFVPMGKLEDKDFFSFENITERRWELFYNCWMKNIQITKDDLLPTLRDPSFSERGVNIINSRIFEFSIKKLLNEFEKVLKYYKNDPFGLRNDFSSYNIKSLGIIRFLAARYIP